MSLVDKVFLFVADGRYSNRGCEAIVRGTVEILSNKFPRSNFILSPFGPRKGLENDAKYETDSRIEHMIPIDPLIRRFSWPWWKHRIFLRTFPNKQKEYQFNVQLKALERADCTLVLGGDNYSLDYGVPHRYVDMGEVLLSKEKPLILWGASVGPFSSDANVERMMSKTLSKYHLICVRETKSVEYLKSIGVEKNVKLMADPAFVMPPKRPKLPDGIYSYINKNTIGVNLTPLIGRKSNWQPDEWVIHVASCMEELIKLDIGPVLFVPHVFDEWILNNDYKFMVEVVKKKPSLSNKLKILPPTFTAQEFKWCISKLRAFIGARTHSTIAALSTFTPTISIAYSMKARGINKDIFGHLNWVLDTNELTPTSLTGILKELLDNEMQVRKELETNIPIFKKRALSAADYLSDFF